MKCPLCCKAKGKRVCALHDGAAICPLCCATVRTVEQCENCTHFQEAEGYRRQRMRQGNVPDFIMRIDEEVEDQVDQALQAIERGRRKEGEAQIRKLYRENDDLSCTQYAMGVVHLSREDPERAAVYFQQAVKTYPYFAEAHFNLSACYRKMLEVNKSLRCLIRARDAAERGGALHTRASSMLCEFEDSIRRHEGVSLEQFLEAGDAFDRGVANMEKGAFRQATIDFRESLRIKPMSPQAYGNLGICLARLGMKDDALAMLDRALEIDPDYEPAKWNRAGIDELADPKTDVTVASIQYSAARNAEDKERAKDSTGAKAGPVTKMLNRLRRQGGAGN